MTMDDERTIIRPGGRTARSSQGPNRDGSRSFGGESGSPFNHTRSQSHSDYPPHSHPNGAASDPFHSELHRGFETQRNTTGFGSQGNDVSVSGVNPIIDHVSRILLVVMQVAEHEGVDLGFFHREATQTIAAGREAGFGLDDHNAMEMVSYGICCLLDDIVQNTPWGKESGWLQQSMLMQYHKENVGGSDFFGYLQQMERDPNVNFHVLEFYYLVLKMGFKGRYRHIPNGFNELAQIADRVYLIISRRQGMVEELSPSWRSQEVRESKLLSLVPHWVIWAVTGVSLLAVFAVFRMLLSNQSMPVNQHLTAIYQEQSPLNVIPLNLRQLAQAARPVQEIQEPDIEPPENQYVDKLRDAFQTEIATGLVAVDEQQQHSVIRLINAQQFASGSAVASPQLLTVVGRIGDYLNSIGLAQKAVIEVIGHSDDQPISTLKFSNNHELSTARANAVKAALGAQLGESKGISARGVADSQPLVPNTSASNRALNRRVDILLRH